MESEKTNNTIEITIIPTDNNWKDYYNTQVARINEWLSDDSPSIDKKVDDLNAGQDNTNETEDKKASDLIIDQFLSGKNIAGVGQGKFTNKAKEIIKEEQTWKEIAQLLKGVKNAQQDGIFNAIGKLQNKLKSICEAAAKNENDETNADEEKKKKGKVRIPWASIHSMVVALRPELFCSIVTENNLNALYNLLKKISLEKKDGNGPVDQKGLSKIIDKKITIDFNSALWNDLVGGWNNANDKEIVKNNMSWYYKSAAVYTFFNKLCNNNIDSNDWACDYPWEVLSALRGSERINWLKDSLINQKNLILTGAPGTGKTYLAKQIARKIIFKDNAPVEDNALNKKIQLKESGQYEFVQFHPSYDYTDFVEGLRPVVGGAGNNVGFKRMDGVFKAFCAKAALVDEAEEKKEIEEKKRTKFVFVIDEINRGEISKIFGELFFSIDPGYRGECDEAKNDNNDNRVKTQYQNLITPDEKFIIYDAKIIEKLKNIERATETIGDTKELEAKEAANTTIGFETHYPFKEGFYVPKNVYVIGTMNDIDRSVESMDFAFRRRFAFVEITAEDSSAIIYSAKEEDKGWNSDIKQSAVDRMNSLNKAIVKKCGLTPQYQIGGAYFLKLKEVGFKFDRLWSEYLQGTLYEYFRGLPVKEIDEKIKQLKDAYNNGIDDDNLTA